MTTLKNGLMLLVLIVLDFFIAYVNKCIVCIHPQNEMKWIIMVRKYQGLNALVLFIFIGVLFVECAYF